MNYTIQYNTLVKPSILRWLGSLGQSLVSPTPALSAPQHYPREKSSGNQEVPVSWSQSPQVAAVRVPVQVHPDSRVHSSRVSLKISRAIISSVKYQVWRCRTLAAEVEIFVWTRFFLCTRAWCSTGSGWAQSKGTCHCMMITNRSRHHRPSCSDAHHAQFVMH